MMNRHIVLLLLFMGVGIVSMQNIYANDNDNGLSLRAVGNADSGYGVSLLYNGEEIARHNSGGEMTLIINNSQFDQEWIIENWKASAQHGNNREIELSGRLELAVPGVSIDVKVSYRVINKTLLEKKIAMTQTKGPRIYYRLENRLEPTTAPDSYWTFARTNDEYGGSFLEAFPAVGFRTKHLSVGLLTDNGVRNIWNRHTQQWDLGKPVPYLLLSRLTDADLVRSSSSSERADGIHYVSMNFGLLDIYKPENGCGIVLPDIEKWVRRGGVCVTEEAVNGGSIVRLQCSPKGENAQIADIPINISRGGYYQICFDYRTTVPMDMHITDASHTKAYGGPTQDHRLKISQDEWITSRQSFYMWDAESLDESAFISIKNDGKDGVAELRNLRVIRLDPEKQAYHPLETNVTSQKTLFVFAQSCKTHREEMIAAQTSIAEGLGFEGTVAEKILFATAQMISWNQEACSFKPHVVPSFHYQPLMFMRDSFWTVISIYDKKVSESVWQQYADRMTSEGGLPTVISPYRDVGGVDYNDSHLFFIILAYVNHIRYGTPINLTRVQTALDFIQKNMDPDNRGVYACKTPGWFDTIWLPKEAVFASNQGLYVNVLRCAKEMGCNVNDNDIRKARDAYRSLFVRERGYVVFADALPNIMSPSTLIGEFVSYWLWNESLLDNEMVIGTLEKLPERSNGTVPCIIKDNGAFLMLEDSDVNQFIPEHIKRIFWPGGVYHNGGSWLLYEYLAYVAGMKHGWEPAIERMRKRLDAEFNGNPEQPVSHEWIPLPEGEAPAYVWWPLNHIGVYGWNCAVITANEVAGLRTRDQSPNF